MPSGKGNSSVPPGVYRHVKSGRLYEVVGMGRHSETLEEFVVYRPLYDNAHEDVVCDVWVRPVAMFFEVVEVGGKRTPRFVSVEV